MGEILVKQLFEEGVMPMSLPRTDNGGDPFKPSRIDAEGIIS